MRESEAVLSLRFHPEVQPHSPQRTCSEPDMTAAKQSRENEGGGVGRKEKGKGDQQDDTAHPHLNLSLAGPVALLSISSISSHFISSGPSLEALLSLSLSLCVPHSLSLQADVEIRPLGLIILSKFCLVLVRRNKAPIVLLFSHQCQLSTPPLLHSKHCYMTSL